MRLLLSVDDLDDGEVRWVLDRAHALASGAPPRRGAPLVGLAFLSESTRTRLGFAAAAARLGGSSVDLRELRDGAVMSSAESFEDTVRTLGGMVDALVVRTPFDLDRAALQPCSAAPLVSGGHGSSEHPTQALIDVLAVEAERGPLAQQRVLVSGDLTMRATRSLLRLLRRMPPRSLTLVAPEGRRGHGVELGPELAARTHEDDGADLSEVDVLYLPGLPAGRGDGSLDDAARRPYAATPERMATLPSTSVVLCPLPAIDEVDPQVRPDPRIRMFEQSDRGVLLRMAVLELLVGGR